MGVTSMILRASKLIRTDTTNSRTLRRLINRLRSVAKELEKKSDTVQLRKLEEIVVNFIDQYAETESSRSNSVTSQIAPELQQKRNKALIQTDAAVNEIQSPPEGHSEGMKSDISKDQVMLRSLLQSLDEMDPEALEEICGPAMDEPFTIGPATSCSNQRKGDTPISVAHLQSRVAHANIEERMVHFRKTSKKPAMVIDVPTMGADATGITGTYLVPLDSSIWTLTETITSTNGQLEISDIWSKTKDATQNRATASQIYFEWQDPNTKVMDIVNKNGYLGIERVERDGEYLVILVMIGEKEYGKPIGIPRIIGQPASVHFRDVFPEYKVSQVRLLQEGHDASDILFNKRVFRHHTNPIVVELCAETKILHRDKNSPSDSIVGMTMVKGEGGDLGLPH